MPKRSRSVGRSSSPETFRDSQKTEKADKSWDYTLFSRNPDTNAGIARWGTAFDETQYLAPPLIAFAIDSGVGVLGLK
jgi:hypothetical protein